MDEDLICDEVRALLGQHIEELPAFGFETASTLPEMRDALRRLVRTATRAWGMVNPEFDSDAFYAVSSLWNTHGAEIQDHGARMLEEIAEEDEQEDDASALEVASGAAEAGAGLPDGRSVLREMVTAAGYPSLEAAVAAHTVFLPPVTVDQAGREALFPVVRSQARRGEIGALPDGRAVMFDDNTTPTVAFLWAAQTRRPTDIQFNHIWTRSQDPDAYTALWNICATPSFLAKLTDTHPGVASMLRYRAFDLYGVHPDDEPVPQPPDGYDALVWAVMPPAVEDLEALLRSRLGGAPKSRAATAARSIGWRFSDGPDASLPAAD